MGCRVDRLTGAAGCALTARPVTPSAATIHQRSWRRVHYLPKSAGPGGSNLLSRIRVLLLTTACLAALPITSDVHAQPRRTTASPVGRAAATRAVPHRTPVRAPVRAGEAITAIKVSGNQRIEPGTIQSYMLVQPGDRYDADRVDRSLKTLYATGLFRDVSIARDGSTLLVKVVENPIINRIAFEGNHKITDETLRPLLELRPRAVFTPNSPRPTGRRS